MQGIAEPPFLGQHGIHKDIAATADPAIMLPQFPQEMTFHVCSLLCGGCSAHLTHIRWTVATLSQSPFYIPTMFGVNFL